MESLNQRKRVTRNKPIRMAKVAVSVNVKTRPACGSKVMYRLP